MVTQTCNLFLGEAEAGRFQRVWGQPGLYCHTHTHSHARTHTHIHILTCEGTKLVCVLCNTLSQLGQEDVVSFGFLKQTLFCGDRLKTSFVAFLVQLKFQIASLLQKGEEGRDLPSLEDPACSSLLFCDKAFWATWWGKGYLVYTSGSQSITEGSPNRNSSREGCTHHKGMLLSVSHSLTCSTSFLLQPRTTCLGMVPPTVDWNTSIKTVSQPQPQVNVILAILQLRFLLIKVTLSCQ